MVSDERRKEIRERLEAATPGPWETGYEEHVTGDDEYVERWVESGGHRILVLDPLNDGSANQNLIANAPADIAYLLAEVDRLEREVEAWERARWEGAP